LKSGDIVPPVYFQIALDIALRITRGELKENTKIYGRSVMSSEYGVSPETIRRAMKLLEDMEIVETKQNSGTTILSVENARLYVERFGAQNNIRSLQKKLKDLVGEQEKINRQIVEVAEVIIRTNERFSQSQPFSSQEADIPLGSSLIGRTLGELKFWQQTGATVIAIRRADKIILSPGPYAVLKEDDTIIFVGDVPCVEMVKNFICGNR
jgi:K+/H+ antiporter YhaU regulatory subunit KhtT